MKSNMWKRITALACAGIMVVSGSGWSTVSANAADTEEAPALEAIAVEEAPALEPIVGIETPMFDENRRNEEQLNVETYAGSPHYIIDENLSPGGISETIVQGTQEGNHSWVADSSASGYKKLPIEEANTDSYQGDDGKRAPSLCDGDIGDTNYWHSRYNDESPSAGGTKPTVNGTGEFTSKNNITLALSGDPQTVKGVTFLPRQYDLCPNGTVSLFNVYVFRNNQWERVQQSGVDVTFQTRGESQYGRNYDEEFIFSQEYTDVTKVRLEIKKSKADVISISEIGVLSNITVLEELKAKLTGKKTELEQELNREIYSKKQLNEIISQINSALSSTDITVVKNAIEISEQPISFENTNGTGTYLSDLKIREEISGWDTHMAVKDKSINHKSLQLIVDGKDKLYDKGLGVHASAGSSQKSNVIYDFGDNTTYKVFETMVGIQKDQGRTGIKIDYAVYLTNNADGNGRPIFTNQAVKRGTLRKPGDNTVKEYNDSEKLIINLQGYRYMKLECHFKNNDDNCGNGNGHVNWADARIYKTWNTDQIYDKYTALRDQVNSIIREDTDGIRKYSNISTLKGVQGKPVLTVLNTANEVQTAITEMNQVIGNLIPLYKITYLNENNESTTKWLEYNEPVTVSTKSTKNNAEFKGWVDNGTGAVVSKKASYTFYVMGDMTLEPKYEAVTQSAGIILANLIVTANTENSANSDVKFVAQAIVPEEDKLYYAGVYWKENDGAENDAWALKCNKQNQFAVTIKNVPPNKKISGRAYFETRNQITGTSHEKFITTPERN